MVSPQELYQSAELSLAAYAVLSQGNTIDFQQKLIDAGMSAKQAEEFAKKYPTVVATNADAATGFFATVFADKTGNLTLAIRGTQELLDNVVNADVMVQGAAYAQIVSLFNWWKVVSNTSGREGCLRRTVRSGKAKLPNQSIRQGFPSIGRAAIEGKSL